MRNFLTIFLFYACPAFSQTDTLKWQFNNVGNVDRYSILYGTDSLNMKSIDTVSKSKNSYAVTMQQTGYYKVLAVGPGISTVAGFVSFAPPVLPDTVFISKLSVTSTYLKWTTAGERNVSSYLIEKSRDGWKTYSQTTNQAAKGSGSYSYRLSWTVFRYSYRIRPIFKNRPPGTPIIFK